MNKKIDIDLIGFHGQTLYHNPQEKISIQLGNGGLLSSTIKKQLVFNFRKNDIKNEGGEGAPLTPIFHKHLVKIKKIRYASLYFKFRRYFKFNIGSQFKRQYFKLEMSVQAIV